MTDTITPAEAAALARIREGWVVVPREPSEEEWNRIAEMCCAIPGSLWQERAMVLWPELISAASMLSAAPEADSHDD